MIKLQLYNNKNSSFKIPMAGTSVSAGFPSPADDFLENRLDISELLIKHPKATFYAQVQGTSMTDDGINDGDILIVDKSLDPQSGDIAVCFVDGEFTVKRIRMKNNEIWLVPANEEYEPLKITEENNFEIWGVVTYTIKKHR